MKDSVGKAQTTVRGRDDGAAIIQNEQDVKDGEKSPIVSNTTLATDLQAHLYDENISDVILLGTDGKTAAAARSILAMRSRFFKSLFYGKFREKDMSEIPLSFSSQVLKAVIEYCYTDEIETTFENVSFEDTARSMVGLVAAGNYFELGGLMAKAHRLTCLMMDEYPALSCAVLDEAMSGDNTGNQTDVLGRVALGIIRLRTESALLPPDTYGIGVQSLGQAAMARVISDDRLQTSALSLFRCLRKWADYKESPGESPDRQAVAIELAQKINFAKVLPSDLASEVAESGLVPLESLVEAYRAHALDAERKGVLSSCSSRIADGKAVTMGQIIVQGAGLEVVNGRYRSTSTTYSMFWHHQQYSRSGFLHGFGDGKFVLHTVTLPDDTKKWFLSFRCGRGRQLDLYSAPVLSEELIPPMQTWVAVGATHDSLRSGLRREKSNLSKNTTFLGHRVEEGRVEPPICVWVPDLAAGEEG